MFRMKNEENTDDLLKDIIIPKPLDPIEPQEEEKEFVLRDFDDDPDENNTAAKSESSTDPGKESGSDK